MRDCTFNSESVTAFVTALAAALHECGLLQPSLEENPQEELLRTLDQTLADVREENPSANLRRCAELELMRFRLRLALGDPRPRLFGPPEGRA